MRGDYVDLTALFGWVEKFFVPGNESVSEMVLLGSGVDEELLTAPLRRILELQHKGRSQF